MNAHLLREHAREPWRTTVNEIRTPKSFCPACGYMVDTATMITSAGRPKPGDVSLCMRCGAVNLFAADLTIREPTEDEMHDLRAAANWPQIREACAIIKGASPLARRQEMNALVENLNRIVRRLLLTNAVLIVMLCGSAAVNVWMALQVRYFGNEAVKANEAHEQTLREQREFLDSLRTTGKR